MADDPWAQYLAPPSSSSSADPWAQFTKPPAQVAQPAAPAAPSPSSSGPSQSWPDYLLDHLHSFSQGLTAATRVATDAPTFGLMDKLFGSQAQADTASAYKQMGGYSVPLALAGGLATGGPELKGASMLGEALGGGRLGATLGSAAVGAPTAALGAYGHEAGWTPDWGDIGKQALIGGALNAGAGALSGPAVEAGQVAGRQFTPRALPPAQTSDQLAAQASAAYKPLDNILYDGKSVVHPELDAVENAIANSTDLTGQQRKLATSTMGIVDDLRARPQLSARDIQSAQTRLNTAGNRGTIQDQQFAPQFHDALQNVLEQGVPQTGVPQGAGPGYAAGVKAAGDMLHGQSQDMARLETMQAKAAVTGGPDVGSQQRSFLTSPEGQQFAPPGSPQYQAGNILAGTAAKPEAIPWYVKHFMLAPMAGALGNEAFAGLSGQEHSPWEHLTADLGVGAALMGASAGYGGLTGRVNALAQQRAIDALKSTISTGTYQAPLAATTPVRNALRMLLLGQSGRY